MHDDPPSGRTAHDSHASHGSVGSYTLGFGLSAVLTVAAFALVMRPLLSPQATVAAIVALAVVQIVVQMYYFLHLDRGSERWNFISLYFTVLIVAILVGGSLWIMTHLAHNLMGTGGIVG